uniref:Uncharacterized protein n=1 Tax=Anopheles dirus TaxID=7168 RepID=A0A182NK39_9DIPT
MDKSCSLHKSTWYELFPQDLPGLESDPSLVEEVRLGTHERLRNRSLEVHLRTFDKPPVPTVHKLVYPSPRKYKQCEHSGNFILDREVLSSTAHIELISEPRDVIREKRPHYVIRKLPAITNRIKTLSRPGPTHVKYTLERHSSNLSSKQKQQLESLLEPKPFVTIPESIGYARQQRSDDAMWRRHRAKQERKLLKNMRRWEVELLKETMRKLSNKLSDYYLSEGPMPLDEEAERIARTVLRCICRFLYRRFPVASQDNAQKHDAIDEFYIEFSQKVGDWIWRMMQTTKAMLDSQKSTSQVRETTSFVSVNSSVFEMQHLDATVAVNLEPLSILSKELVNECLDKAVLAVENGNLQRCSSMCKESTRVESLEDKTTSTIEESQAEEPIATSNSHEVDTSRTSIDVCGDGIEESMEEDQVTVIENIPDDPMDDEPTPRIEPTEDEKPQQPA